MESYCYDCQRAFRNDNDLRSHLNSSIHVLKDKVCPMAGCNRSFTSYSTVVAHLEAGTCSSGITRQLIDNYIVRHQIGRLITTQPAAIGYGDWRPAPVYQSSSASWDSYYGTWNCTLCDCTFPSQRQLDQHLASPKHSPSLASGSKLYRCPIPNCRREFSTLSGLTSHGEKGSCGLGQNVQAQATMQGFFNGAKTITYGQY